MPDGLGTEDANVAALLVTSVLLPVLDLDLSEADRSRFARELWDAAWHARGERDRSAQIEARLEASDELTASREPEGLAFYRARFLASLYYAVRTLSGDPLQHLRWAVFAVTESVEFLADEDDFAPFDQVQVKAHIESIIESISGGASSAAVAAATDHANAAAATIRQAVVGHS